MDSSVRTRRAASALCVLAGLTIVSIGMSTLVERTGVESPDRSASQKTRPAPSVLPAAAKPGPTEPRRLVMRSGWASLLPEHGRPLLLAPPAENDGAAARDDGEPRPQRPVVTMLHGMCSDPAATCELARDAATELGWFACPTGNGSCGSAADWTGSGEQKAAFVDESLRELDRLRGPFVGNAAGDVLIGFSRGAFVARDIAYARADRWVGLILIGAEMVPDAGRLMRSGIRRVVLAAGDLDGARPTMQRAAAILSKQGLPARFVSLGAIYHTLPADLDERLRPWLAWVRATAPTS